MERYIDNVVATLVCAACIVSFFIGIHTPLEPGCPMWHRATYMICHANIWHLTGNVWCMYTIRKSTFRDSWYMHIIAIAIAMTSPATAYNVVGLSGMLYALTGMLSWQASEKIKFHSWCLGFILLLCFLPLPTANILHLYCYIVGIAIGYAIRWIKQ